MFDADAWDGFLLPPFSRPCCKLLPYLTRAVVIREIKHSYCLVGTRKIWPASINTTWINYVDLAWTTQKMMWEKWLRYIVMHAVTSNITLHCNDVRCLLSLWRHISTVMTAGHTYVLISLYTNYCHGEGSLYHCLLPTKILTYYFICC